MIGQSGLPMMNSLAAAKDQGQEGILTPVPETAEGEFEKAFANTEAHISDETAAVRAPASSSDTGVRTLMGPAPPPLDQPEATQLLTGAVGQSAPPAEEWQRRDPALLNLADKPRTMIPAAKKGQPAVVGASPDPQTIAGASEPEPKAPIATAKTDLLPTATTRPPTADAKTNANIEDLSPSDAPALPSGAPTLPSGAPTLPSGAPALPSGAPTLQMVGGERPLGTSKRSQAELPKPVPNLPAPETAQLAAKGGRDSPSSNSRTPDSPIIGAGGVSADEAGLLADANVVNTAPKPLPMATDQVAKPAPVSAEAEPAVKAPLWQLVELSPAPQKTANGGPLDLGVSPGDGRPEGSFVPSRPSLLHTGEAESRLRNLAATQAQGTVTTASGLQQAMLHAEDQFDFTLSSPVASAHALLSRTDSANPVQSPLPVEPRVIVQQVAQAIVHMDVGRTEITLDPVELGRVSLTFVTRDEGVSVTVTADRPETADLLRRNSEQLQRDLLNAGYDDVDLGFAQDDGGSDHQKAEQSASHSATAGVVEVTYNKGGSETGLDIRI